MAAALREVFGAWPPFSGRPVTEEPLGDVEADFMRENFPGRHWTEVHPEALTTAAQESAYLTDEALAYFLPAFFLSYLEARSPHAGNLLVYIPSWIARLFPLSRFGYSGRQVDAVISAYELMFPSPGVVLQAPYDDEEQAREMLMLERLELLGGGEQQENA